MSGLLTSLKSGAKVREACVQLNASDRRIRLSQCHRRLFSQSRRLLHPGHASDSSFDPDDDFGNYSIVLPKEPFVWGTSHITPRPVPAHIVRPPYVSLGDDTKSAPANYEGWQESYSGDGRIPLGGGEELTVRRAARLARDVLSFAGTLVRPGVTTESIDAVVHGFIVSRGAYPSPLLYAGFPRSCCTSVNNIVAHGIPDDRPLENGDIVNIDITVFIDGFHGDTSRTFLVDNVDDQGRDLVQATSAALEAGISACGPGRPFKGIGNAIHKCLRGTSYSVNSAFTGHGIGTVFHRPPWIYHTLNEEPGSMIPGHCFTIEPCLVQGSNPRSWIFPDGWTASTENCARSAQEEHMILITESGAEVLTR